MNFTFEQIMDFDDFREACEIFLNLAKDEEMKETLKEILYNGKFGDYCLKSKFACRDNPGIERQRRIAMASVFIRNPQTFEFFVKNKINVFHGTNANALPGILKYGMNSQETLEEEGIPLLTGERWSSMYNKRAFISFTDVLEIAEKYSGLSSPEGSEELSFSVIIGISEPNMEKADIVSISSDISEIGVLHHLPLEYISCICVPEDKVEFVKKMVNNSHITVLGMKDLGEKAYQIDRFESVQISPEIYEGKNSNGKRFSLKELGEIAKSRTLSKMKEFIENVKGFFEKGGEDELGRKVR